MDLHVIKHVKCPIRYYLYEMYEYNYLKKVKFDLIWTQFFDGLRLLKGLNHMWNDFFYANR